MLQWERARRLLHCYIETMMRQVKSRICEPANISFMHWYFCKIANVSPSHNFSAPCLSFKLLSVSIIFTGHHISSIILKRQKSLINCRLCAILIYLQIVVNKTWFNRFPADYNLSFIYWIRCWLRGKCSGLPHSRPWFDSRSEHMTGSDSRIIGGFYSGKFVCPCRQETHKYSPKIGPEIDERRAK